MPAPAGGGQGASPADEPEEVSAGGGGGRPTNRCVGRGHLAQRRLGRGSAAGRWRGWGWMTQLYVSAGYKRPFWNKAKELLFSGKQVTSYTIGSFDPAFYCEVRKHYGFVWFEMQHSTMSWDEVAKMIAACPGPDGAAPMIRMPDQLESSIQKATDLGAIGLIFPTIRDGHQALEAARYLALSAVRPPQFGSRTGRPGVVRVPGGYQNTYNDNMLVVMMIETLDGILNADEIASTFGVDVVIQGNNDLSRFSGWAQNDPRYQALLTVSRNATLKAGNSGATPGSSTHRQSAQRRHAVRAERAVDGWLDAAGARTRQCRRADHRRPRRPRRSGPMKPEN